MSDIIDRLEWRYAVKKFDPSRKLKTEQLDKLKRAFNLTATSYGLQPIRMLVLQDQDLQNRLLSHSYNQQQVAQASHLLVFCVETNVDGDYVKSYFERVKEIRGTSDQILNPFREYLVREFSNKDQKEIQEWATRQAYLAMGNLLTICALEEIDACPMEGFEPEAYNELLGLKEKGLSAVLVMPVGYRAQDDMFADFKKVRRKMSKSIIEINNSQ
ncbi:NAD(P)H-dependent oxidoreductase [Lentiprolixibacter aurantiacus]|uniref:NAD(P)H-dependent oxidoreductase n=1 Tax=Lentiprolixibacter aurantiacus TaxID=2993939 RepID=A0AAE3SPS5_9FLAO|nr:NAD(P)H-dependent oxidoreductase [Lentiprolixibacter aurantiacus]MCX2719747.1 NAD(P)H-dependent oxidoreductase [Lentiprolixibacter aurantiacus]